MNAFRLPCLAAAACVALLLSACSSAGTSAVESISVRLVELKPGPPATMTLTYINASVLPIGVSSTIHKLYLNGRLVGEVASDRAIGLPAAGTASQEIPLTLTGTLDGLSGPTPYRLETTVIVLAGEDRLRSRTRAEGTVNLP